MTQAQWSGVSSLPRSFWMIKYVRGPPISWHDQQRFTISEVAEEQSPVAESVMWSACVIDCVMSDVMWQLALLTETTTQHSIRALCSTRYRCVCLSLFVCLFVCLPVWLFWLFYKQQVFQQEPRRWGRQKSRLWANIWLQCVLLPLRTTRCYQYGATVPPSRKLWHL